MLSHLSGSLSAGIKEVSSMGYSLNITQADAVLEKLADAGSFVVVGRITASSHPDVFPSRDVIRIPILFDTPRWNVFPTSYGM